MTNTEELKEYATNFYPDRNDILIAYSVISFYKDYYDNPNFSNLGCSFSNVLRILEKKYLDKRI